MPYIDKIDRNYIDVELQQYFKGESSFVDIEYIASILRNVPSGKIKGAFNYFVTRLWLNTFFPKPTSLGYTALSDALGVFRDMEIHLDYRLMQRYETEIAKPTNGEIPEIRELLSHMFLNEMTKLDQEMGLQ